VSFVGSLVFSALLCSWQVLDVCDLPCLLPPASSPGLRFAQLVKHIWPSAVTMYILEQRDELAIRMRKSWEASIAHPQQRRPKC